MEEVGSNEIRRRCFE